MKQEEKGLAEGEMVGWHHRLSGLEFEQTSGDGEGQGYDQPRDQCMVRHVNSV